MGSDGSRAVAAGAATGSSALRWVGALALGAALAGAAGLALVQMVGPESRDLAALLRGAPAPAGTILAAPFVAALLAALVMGLRRSGAAAAARPSREAPRKAAPAAAPSPPLRAANESALQLLALLQQEGRFVDFLEEDLTGYSDEQVGSAVRSIHEGCRKALAERLALAPVLAGAEGATVTVEKGFDPAAVRVTGNVRGQPPYRGVLRHPGWRSTALALPERAGDHDVAILAPAEVEVL